MRSGRQPLCVPGFSYKSYKSFLISLYKTYADLLRAPTLDFFVSQSLQVAHMIPHQVWSSLCLPPPEDSFVLIESRGLDLSATWKVALEGALHPPLRHCATSAPLL